MFIYINICSFQLSTILQNVDFRFSVFQTDDDRWFLRLIFRFEYVTSGYVTFVDGNSLAYKEAE